MENIKTSLVSEELSSVETHVFYCFWILHSVIQFQKNLVVWKQKWCFKTGGFAIGFRRTQQCGNYSPSMQMKRTKQFQKNLVVWKLRRKIIINIKKLAFQKNLVVWKHVIFCPSATGQPLFVSEELSSVETQFPRSTKGSRSRVSEELSSVETSIEFGSLIF